MRFWGLGIPPTRHKVPFVYPCFIFRGRSCPRTDIIRITKLPFPRLQASFRSIAIYTEHPEWVRTDNMTTRTTTTTRSAEGSQATRRRRRRRIDDDNDARNAGECIFDNNRLKHVYYLDCLFMYLLFFNRYVIVKIR